ncbi:MAG: C45 family autoproteolytic acyltransferase/hydrolase [Planctomycetota bacterium]|nr:C45 family autoproteolytic acyltransferase/hydrolase [Planctomycetota bacterium]
MRATAAWAVLLLAALVFAVPAVGLVMGLVAPPLVADPGTDPVQEDGRIAWGASYRERVGSIEHLHLVGDAETMGYAHGALMGERIAALETDLLRTFTELVPSFLLRHLVLGLVSFNNRSLAQHFTGRELRELAAMGHAHARRSDLYGSMSPGFTRAVQYHALHDASQYMIDNPLVNAPQVGCTAVVARGARSRSGRIQVGRLFDFEGGNSFDLDKVVISYDPQEGQKFVSVVWPGMVGAVTGLNESGIWISVNSSVSDSHAVSGRPVVLVVREALQFATTLDQAAQLFEQATLFVSANIVIVSGDEDAALVVQVGPGGSSRLPLDGDSLAITNHFRGPAWDQDAATARRLLEGTSPKRLARAEQLLAARVHDSASLLEVLRNRLGPDGQDIGFGNRGTINAWIGAHLVVADPRAQILWVCEPSHGLGRALAFGMEGPLDLQPLPASDELLWHERVASRFESILDETRGMLERGEYDQAAVAAEHLLELNPSSFAAYECAALATADLTERRLLLERSLELLPAYPADEARVRAHLDALK